MQWRVRTRSGEVGWVGGAVGVGGNGESPAMADRVRGESDGRSEDVECGINKEYIKINWIHILIYSLDHELWIIFFRI